MSQLRFLCDEDVSHDIVQYLRQGEPAMDIVVVGEPGGPPKSTGDLGVYREAVAQGRTLISGDLSTMCHLVAADLQSGGHNAGVIFLKPGRSIASYGADLHLIWFCETAEDWVDRIDFIPY
jgi:hypothetical protein